MKTNLGIIIFKSNPINCVQAEAGGKDMRIVALIAFSFAAAVFVSIILPWSGWYLIAAAILAVSGVSAWFFFHKHRNSSGRIAVIMLAMAAGFLYFTGYNSFLIQPFTDLCDTESRSFCGTVWDHPVSLKSGTAVTLDLHPGPKAVLFGDETLLDLVPGDKITGTAKWQEASGYFESDTATYTERGVFVLLNLDGRISSLRDGEGTLLNYLKMTEGAVQKRIPSIWKRPETCGFIAAALTGNRSYLTEEDYLSLVQNGVAHMIQVYGICFAYLIFVFSLLLSEKKRRWFYAFAILAVIFYSAICGFSPAAYPCCVMMFALLAAAFFPAKYDPVTSLSIALLLIVLYNPYSVGGIILQLSFAAVLGLVVLSGRLYRILAGWVSERNRHVRRIVRFLAAHISSSLSVLIFTLPLVIYYYNVYALIAPLSNLIILPIAAWNHFAGFISVLTGILWFPAGRLLGAVCHPLAYFILCFGRWIPGTGDHIAFFSSLYMKYWIAYLYALAAICFLSKGPRRRFIIAAVLAAVSLFFAVRINSREYHYGCMNAIVVNVGQGECILLYSGNDAVAVDCGSGNSYINAGIRAADQLTSIGIHKLSALVLTHYHYDHTSGVYDLLSRVSVDKLWLPDIEDESGARDRIIETAQRFGTAVEFIHSTSNMVFGEADMTVYPPLMSGDMNEQGLTALCSAGDFDILITGDMAGTTEKRLVETYRMPDVEVLLVSHHGSRYSSDSSFLSSVCPDTAIISVGYNTYGHPTQEAISRLKNCGAEIYRTDEQGSILITVIGGEE